MSYKQKLFCFILPLIVLPMLVVAAIFLINTTSAIQSLQLELMALEVASLQGRCQEAHQATSGKDGEDPPGRRESAQAEIIDLARKEVLAGVGLAIIDCRQQKVYAPDMALPIEGEPLEKIIAGREGALRFEGAAGMQVAVFRAFPEWDWVIAAVAAEDAFLESVEDSRRITVAVTGMAILLALVFMWLLIDSIARPIRILEEGTRKISRGDFDVAVKVRTRDEIGRLSTAFNLMSLRIRELVADLRREIRERRETEAALRLSEERFRQVADNIREVVWLYDWAAGRMIYVSPAFETIWGRSLETLYARPEEWADSIHPEDRSQAAEAFARLAKHGMVSREYRIIRPDGTVRWIADRGVVIRNGKGEVSRIAGIAEDMTYRVRTQEALLESEGRFATFFNTSPDALSITSLQNGRYVDVNENFLAETGYAREEVIGKTSLEIDIWHNPQDRLRFYRRLQRTGQVANFEIVYRMKDGTLKTGLTSSKIITLNHQPHIIAITRDITQLNNARGALQESEEKYRLLVDNAIEGIFIIQDGLIQFPNPKTLQLTGYPREELEQRQFIDFVHPQDRHRIREHLERPDAPPAVPRPFRIRDKHGRELWVELSTVAVLWEGKPAALNFLRDITLQKKLEDQFQQAQKMEAIGALAGGIAHDFNNLLMGIQGRTSLMMMNADESHPDYEHMREIQEYVHSATELIRQLLGFARSGKYRSVAGNLNDLVWKTAAMFGRTRKEIRIHTACAEALPPVEVDPVQIEQVLINLYLNAWQAMPRGGEIFIETQEVRLGPDVTRLHQIPAGNYIRVSVRDTGEGMDPETIPHIFEPFFTTKGRGRGTGLGLSSAYRIIRNHGGLITASSGVGQGTTFAFCLPAAGRAVPDALPQPRSVTRGAGTILLVDDEEMILEVGRTMLEELGYRVLTAAGGNEAVRLFREHRRGIDLLILDMVMPEQSGPETFRRLKEIDPAVKVLVASGYSITSEVEEILADGGLGFLQKPFALETLSARVAELMG